MIDPLTIGAAYLAAKTAVGGIKEAIKLGKDAGEIAGEISKFFHSAAHIENASKKIDEQRLNQAKQDTKNGNKKSYYELTAEAMDVAIKAEEVKLFEKEIKDLLVWSGRGHIYHAMLTERNRLEHEIQRSEALEILEQSRREKQIAEQKEFTKELMWCAVAIALALLAFWGIIEFMISRGMVGR
jgi:signal recognition particle GTPase